MTRDRAAYMREYRARQREAEETIRGLNEGHPGAGTGWADRRISELEEEVRHLKAELAKRPEYPVHAPVLYTPEERYDQRPLRAVPKSR